ncbi:MAG: metallophosphatase [Deltaproteobacteria bacterium]|nr:MAG: metallophosphatase [Deltaproteobacteria bacterium]
MTDGPMRTLFVGDVHGCRDELARLLDLADADRVILLGDLFTKGPDPGGTWRLIQQHRCEAVLGNHDLAILNRARRGGPVDLPDEAVAWLGSLPLFIHGEGPEGPWVAVHAGVDPGAGPAGTTMDQAVAMRRYPGDSPDDPFWWSLWRGPPLVIYGHDAVRGLVDRRPHSLGLDTGCVYGGALSGYLVEDDRLLSVPAGRIYRPVPPVPPPGVR